MKKSSLFWGGLVFLLLLSLMPHPRTYAAEVQYTSSALSSKHEVNDYIPVKAIKADASVKPNIEPINTSLTLSLSKPINSSPDVASFYKSWGRLQLSRSADGEDKVKLYDLLATSFRNTKDTKAVPIKDIYSNTYYAMYLLQLNSLSNPMTLTPEDAQAVYSIFRNEHPEYYWLYYGVLYISSNSKYIQCLYIVTSSDYDTPKERASVDTIIADKSKEYRTAVKGLTSNYEIAKVFHDKIINDIDYLYDEKGDPSEELYAHNIVGVFDGTGVVCEGYAKAYQYLLNQLNIPNLYIPGIAKTDYIVGGHAWNMVMADNDYFYNVDTTWDDLGSGGIDYDYFMSGSDGFDKEHTPDRPDGEGFNYLYALPTVPKDDYDSNMDNSGVSITNMTSTLTADGIIYDGTPKKPVVTITSSTGVTLKAGIDYQLYYANNINAGTATVTIVGNGNYTGLLTKNFTIAKKSIAKLNAKLSSTNYSYTGSSKQPTITISGLVKDKDYKVAYTNNTNAGTATVAITGIGNYSDSIRTNFTISKGTLSVKVAEAKASYDGNYHTISLSVPKGAKTIYSRDNKNFVSSKPSYMVPGTYKIYYKVQQINYNDYYGSATIIITKKALTSLSVTLSSTSFTYKGSAIIPGITLKNGSKALIKNKDYKLTYSNNIYPGTATVTINGIGYYTGTVKKTYSIKIGTPTAKVSSGSKKATISWSKVNAISGYELHMSTSSNGKYSLIKTVSSSTTKYTKSNLIKGKTYYFKIRAYKSVNGKKVYSSYSIIMPVTAK